MNSLFIKVEDGEYIGSFYYLNINQISCIFPQANKIAISGVLGSGTSLITLTTESMKRVIKFTYGEDNADTTN